MANGQDLTDLVPHLRTVHFALLLACILTLLPTMVGRRGEVSEAHRQHQKVQAMRNSWDRWTQKFALEQVVWLRTLGVQWLAPAAEHAYIDSPTLTQAGIRHGPGSVLGVRLVGAPLYFHLHVKRRLSELVLAVPYGKLNVSDVFPLEISFPGEDSGSQRFASLAAFREFWAGARLPMVTFLQRFLPVAYLVVDGAIRSELRASPTIELGRSERPERAERSMPAIAAPKAAVLKRLRVMEAEGLSLQAIANRLNNEGVPTLSGKGRWQKGTISNLLAQMQETGP
jgi:Recombinase